MKSAFFLFTLLFLLPFYLQAQEVAPYLETQEVAPLQLGNVWLYETDAFFYRIEVVDSAVIIDSMQYFESELNYQGQYSRMIRLRSDDFYVIKEDSTYPEPLNERIYYKKNAVPGETWEVLIPGHLNTVVYTIYDTVSTNIFGTLVTGKLLNENFGSTHWNYVWTEEFGKLSKKNAQGAIVYSLRACVINGIVYGDTNFTALSVNSDIPELTYELFDNYPNPFNPTTTIIFTISDLRFTILKVYDVLGNEIATLVNEEKSAGEYEVEFNGDGLTSGIYFIQLQAGNFVETRKMILLK